VKLLALRRNGGAHNKRAAILMMMMTKMKMRFCCALLGLLLCLPICSRGQQQQKQLLIVLIHGMGDTCCNPLSLGKIESLIESSNTEETNTNKKVISIKFGRNSMSDFISGFIGDAFSLVKDFGCAQLRKAKEEMMMNHDDTIENDDKVETILLGFSQGGVFARAMVETCEDEVNALITFGAPHSGVWKFPGCDKMANALSRKWCEYSRKVASKAAYSKMLKSKSVQASYFRDVSDAKRFEQYVRSGSLLSVINGEEDGSDDEDARGEERKMKMGQRRREKMCNLDVFAMFSFEKDEVVVPRDSAVFSDAPSVPFEYTEEKSSELLNVRETKFYLNEEDGLCLRELDEKNRMKIDVVPDAHHMQFSLEWFTENVIDKYIVAAPEKREEEVKEEEEEDKKEGVIHSINRFSK
jgi:palmitoyl-protein thioesterase